MILVGNRVNRSARAGFIEPLKGSITEELGELWRFLPGRGISTWERVDILLSLGPRVLVVGPKSLVELEPSDCQTSSE